MTFRLHHAALAVGFAAGLLQFPAHAAPATTGAVTSVQPVRTESMQNLLQAAQLLRESIQALAQKPPGPEREAAINEAHQALLRTQQAMVTLPPELRSTGTMGSTAGYDTSVKKLMKAADALRESVQEMATQPAGPRRNAAIQTANRALLDTQVAMANAYGTSHPQQTASNAAVNVMECRRLGQMIACQ